MEKNNLIKKFLSFSIGGYINALIGLITVPIITRMLSPEQYGIASLINIITEIMVVICCLGMDQGFVRFFYEEKEENRGALLYNSLYYCFFITPVSFIIIFLLKKRISIFILGKEDGLIWILIILSILFGVLKLFSFLVIRMQQRGKVYSLLNVLIKILEFLFIIFFYNFYKDNYKTLILAILLSQIIATILAIILEKKIWTFNGKGEITRNELTKFSIPLLLTVLLTWIFASSDKITIKFFSNLNEVGLYSGAFKIISLLIIIQTGFTTFWTPVIFEHNKKYPKNTTFYKKMNDYLSLIFFLFGVGILLSRNLIVILLGKNYYETLYIMPMLVFIPIMYLLSETTMVGIAFKKKTKYFLYISVAISVANIMGNILLVPYLGARGAAISTGISYIIFFSLRTYFSIKLIDFKFNIKRMYLIIFMILLYALFLTFYDYVFFTIVIGLFLELIIILVYYPILKKIYKIYKTYKRRSIQ